MKNNDLIVALGILISLYGCGKGADPRALQVVQTQASVSLNAEVELKEEVVEVCGESFSVVKLESTDSDIKLASELVHITGSPYQVAIPKGLEIANPERVEVLKDIKIKIKGEQRFTTSYPLLPDFPILETFKQEEICPNLISYAQRSSSSRSIGPRVLSEVNSINTQIGVILEDNLASIELSDNLVAKLEGAIKVEKENLERLNSYIALETFPVEIYKPKVQFLVITQDEYYSDSLALANTRKAIDKIDVSVVKVSELPGYNANAPTPLECQGDFLKECYHYWEDTIVGMDPLAVPMMRGFHAQTKPWQKYNRISFIPGLIRAYIRKVKKEHPLKAVLLVGNPIVMPSYFTRQRGYNGASGRPSHLLHTDTYFMIPNIPMSPSLTVSHHQDIMPMLWSCQDNIGIEKKYWCDQDEWRWWGDSELGELNAYDWGVKFPVGRAFDDPISSYQWSAFDSLEIQDMVAVGRLVTNDNMTGVHDSSVSNYTSKLAKWHNELPSMKNNSILSIGGSTSDTWIFHKEDIDLFKSAFGGNSKVYASDYFLPLSKCEGCEFQDGLQIKSELISEHKAAWFLNGHGGFGGIQAPQDLNESHGFASGNIYGMNHDLKLKYSDENNTNVLTSYESTGKLVGIVFANSCSPSNFSKENGIHNIFIDMYQAKNQRSFAEQLVSMQNSGAMNTFLNSDVGWGNQDNRYNQKFLYHIENAWKKCGRIGDALKGLIYDAAKRNISGINYTWQPINRVFFGRPLK